MFYEGEKASGSSLGKKLWKFFLLRLRPDQVSDYRLHAGTSSQVNKLLEINEALGAHFLSYRMRSADGCVLCNVLVLVRIESSRDVPRHEIN